MKMSFPVSFNGNSSFKSDFSSGGQFDIELEENSEVGKVDQTLSKPGWAADAGATGRELAKKLPLSGGTMTGDINMDNKKIVNIPYAKSAGQPVPYDQMFKTIADNQFTFNYKGEKDSFNQLPESGNKLGDIWRVLDEDKTYIWLLQYDQAKWTDFNLMLRVNQQEETYIFYQTIPSSQWIINHKLNKYPSVTVVDSSGARVLGEVKFLDSNNIEIIFSGQFSGKAFLN